MAEILRSVGLDVGTTSTQMILSELTIENKSSTFSVPEMEISHRKILYKSPIHFTPLLRGDLVDGEAIRTIIASEYEQAGICRSEVDTGAIIITGETSRKENAATVLQNLSDFAGEFVVATAGPDLESVLAAKGAGAVEFSAETGANVLHMDIGGGTSNLAFIENGRITATACLNVGGRLLKFDSSGTITYRSPVLHGIFDGSVGTKPTLSELERLADNLVAALEMAAGLREQTQLLAKLWTQELSTPACQLVRKDTNCVISFSGGVADCIEQEHPDFTFGDMGPILGRAIRHSRLCHGQYRLGTETIRATVIGAGCHSTQLSGSTVYHQNVAFPLKNLPVVTEIAALSRLDKPGVLALPGISAAHYQQVVDLAEHIVAAWPNQPVLIALQQDMAKALGHALALRFPREKVIMCIDRVFLTEEGYLDISAPVGTALPVVVKTLILQQ